MSEATEQPGRVIGLDFGTKRIGVAISDGGRRIATGLTVLPNDSSVGARLAELIDEHGTSVVVVGMPTSLDGSRGPAAERVDSFVRETLEPLGVDVQFVDERFTTTTAERALLEADTSRAKRRKSIDKVAATIILQSFLDRP